METDIDSVIELLRDIDSRPEVLLRPQKKDDRMKNVLQRMYLFSMHHDANKTTDILPELVLEDMDQEQIWQQLDIKNNHSISHYLSQVAGVAALHEQKLSIQVENKQDETAMVSPKKEKKRGPIKESVKKTKKVKKSNLDQSNDKSGGGDRFFDLDEMNKFLDMEDAKADKNGKADSGQIDFFQEMDNEDDIDIKYDDFYDDDNENNEFDDEMDMDNEEGSDEEENENNVNGHGNDEGDDDNDLQQAGEESSDDDDDESEANELQKSSFEERQDRKQKQISVHESQMLDEKPWQLKGEILAGGRPQNSLLEEVLEFESSVRPAPVITEETTLKLEDIIRQRIKDQAWDDVELKIREKLVAPEYRKQIVLDQEKSKMSLSKIYEADYQREKDKQNEQNIESAEQNPEIEKIERNMNSLLDKLNSLFHFFFTPTPAVPEPRIITNTPALQMEDALPVAVSDATLLAPEEVFKTKQKSLLGKSERSTTDKNRERRKKKLKQQAIMKRFGKQDTKLISVTKAKKSKMPTKTSKSVEMINHDARQPKSSKQFFARMQENSMSNGSKKIIKQKTQRAKAVKL